MNKLYIFPYSGSGLEVLDCIPANQEVIFISDDRNLQGQQYKSYPILAREDFFNDQTNPEIIAVHGSATSFQNRKTILDSFGEKVNWRTVIHPSAQISRFADIGKNVFISAGVVIGPNVKIGDNVIILANSTIHHDSTIGENTIICGNVLIAGAVDIASGVYIGAATSVKNGLRIEAKALIGIGSVVLKDILENEVWYGNPACKK